MRGLGRGEKEGPLQPGAACLFSVLNKCSAAKALEGIRAD
jgi:hypothetical protein